MRDIIRTCYENSKKILNENKDLLKLIAETLLEEETITKEQIDYLVKHGHLEKDEDSNEDTYAKYSFIVNAINKNLQQYKKEQAENEKIKKLMDKYKTEDEQYVSHADENEGGEIY